MLQLIQSSLKGINLYRVKESGCEFTKAASDSFLKEEGNQLNHWTEFICMSIDKSYFALLSVTHKLQSHKTAPRLRKARIRQPGKVWTAWFSIGDTRWFLALFPLSLQGQVLEAGLDNLSTLFCLIIAVNIRRGQSESLQGIDRFMGSGRKMISDDPWSS